MRAFAKKAPRGRRGQGVRGKAFGSSHYRQLKAAVPSDLRPREGLAMARGSGGGARSRRSRGR